jgi:two-component system cell cycle sensor histidine kinase PleC
VAAAVEDAMRIVGPRAQQGNVAIEVEVPSHLELIADRRALKQVLINILANAVKFTPEGGRVSLSARSESEHVTIVIADTGIGIPAAEIGKLGRPFEQVENQFTKTKSGSGLGLAISNSLVEMHGGSILIASEVGRGTTVTLTLPIASDAMVSGMEQAVG